MRRFPPAIPGPRRAVSRRRPGPLDDDRRLGGFALGVGLHLVQREQDSADGDQAIATMIVAGVA